MPDKRKIALVPYKTPIIVDENGIKERKYQKVKREVPTHFKKYYNGADKILMHLDGCPRVLIDYLAEIMTDSQVVFSDAKSRKDFNNYLLNYKHPGYSDATIKLSFIKLNKKELLVQYKKGVFIVNPIYISKSVEKKRFGIIKMVLEIPFYKAKELEIDMSYYETDEHKDLIDAIAKNKSGSPNEFK